MTSVLLDLLVVGIFVFCVWQGYRKGLILTVAGVLIVIISAFLAGKVAASYSDVVAEKVLPIMSWLADDALDEASRGKGRVNEMTDRKLISEIAAEVYEGMGITNKEADKMVEKALQTMTKAETDARTAIAQTLLYSLAYVVLCIFAFLFFMIGLTLLIHFLASLFKLPVLNLIDKVGGTAVGALYGLLTICALCWAMRFLGIVLDPEIVQKTVIMKFFVNYNMLAGLMGFKVDGVLAAISGK